MKYTYNSDDDCYKDDDGNIRPTCMSVNGNKLKIGDIIFIDEGNNHNHSSSRSAVVTAVETKKKTVTTVDSNGRTEVHDYRNSWIKFNLQCSQEEIDAANDRLANIKIRRYLSSISSELSQHSTILTKMLDPAQKRWKSDVITKNKKVANYAARLQKFAEEIDAMYREIGRDLKIGDKAKKKSVL